MTHNNQVATQQKTPISMGFMSLDSYEFMQRAAKMFSQSSMVPAAYRDTVTKGYGKNITTEVNPSAIPNCVIALNMSSRMNADPLMIMQNLHVIEGRPSWSSQFIIASINSCGRYSPLRFELVYGEDIDATQTTYEWQGTNKVPVTKKFRVRNMSCVAWALELATNTRLDSPKVTMEMAVIEGWYGKNGSKWQSIPELMIRYRAAAFFGRLYAPELLMGLPATEEVQDVIDVERQPDGSYAMPNDYPMATPTPQAPSKPVSKSETARTKVVNPATPKEETPAQQPESKNETPKEQPLGKSVNPDTGEIATINPGQVKYLQQKIKVLELTDEAVVQMLDKVGSKTLDALNLDQFDAIKSELLSMS